MHLLQRIAEQDGYKCSSYEGTLAIHDCDPGELIALALRAASSMDDVEPLAVAIESMVGTSFGHDDQGVYFPVIPYTAP